MHPIIQRDLMQARVADLHRDAERDRLAQAVSRVRPRPPRRRYPIRRLPAVRARHVLTMVADDSP